MAVVSCTVDGYDRGMVKQALEVALSSFGGFEKLLNGRQKILLKPNFVVAESKERATTTHPDFYMAVAEMLLAQGKDVTIGESPAFGSCQGALRLHGVSKECRAKGIHVLTFSRNRKIQGIVGHKHYERLTIAAELENFDAIINLPKVKVHQQFVFTGATKNLYGCVVGKRKTYRHFVSGNKLDDFSQMIHINAQAVSPILNIADGIIAMHRNGPRGGDPFPLKRLLVADSCLEMDWLIARMIGLKPATTPLFAICNEHERHSYAKASEGIDDLPDITGFVQARMAPIEFTFTRVMASVWKSLKEKLRPMQQSSIKVRFPARATRQGE